MKPGQKLTQKNRKVAIIAAGVFFSMVGLAYASVPLYQLFCQTTGFAGTPRRVEVAPAQATDKFITIRFDGNTASTLNWNFQPRVTTMRVRIGEQNIAYFDATNLAGHENIGTAVFNVAPDKAGAYFSKIQCFCFTEQKLRAGEKAELPVTFFVDPDLLKDADTKGLNEITLSYTFYPADSQQAAN